MEDNPIFLTMENPVIVGILLFVIIVILIYIFSKYFYFPLVKKYFEDKKRNAIVSRILFETDPNPMFRIDGEGNLLQQNPSFKSMLKKYSLTPQEFYNEIENRIIQDSSTKNYGFEFRGSYYEVIIEYIKELQVKQIYILDKTELREKEILLNEYKQKVVQAKSEEEIKYIEHRNELARELHDSINHNLLFVIKKLGNRYGDIDEVKELNSVFNEIRKCSRNVKPLNFERDDFSFTIFEMVEKIKQTMQINIQISITEKISKLNSRVLFHIYRIFQELLCNSAKYSQAKNIEICIDLENGIYFVTYEDDGVGFTPVKISENHYTSSGLGIVNIQERINEIGAVWSIDSEVGRGTVVIIEVPADE